MASAEVLAGVDIVALRLGEQGALQLLLIRRGQAPFEGQWALPGVLVNGRCADASLDAAALILDLQHEIHRLRARLLAHGVREDGNG